MNLAGADGDDAMLIVQSLLEKEHGPGKAYCLKCEAVGENEPENPNPRGGG